MSYATQAQLAKRLGNVKLAGLSYRGADPAHTEALAAAVLAADAGAQAVIQNALDEADAYVNRYVLGIVDVTDSTVQTALADISRDVAIYYLFRDQVNLDDTNPYASAFREASRQLRDIASRKIHLAADPLAPSGIAYSSTESTEPVFTTDSTTGSLRNF